MIPYSIFCGSAALLATLTRLHPLKRWPDESHGLFLERHNLSNRQDAKVAKTNNFDVSACGETTSGKLGVLASWRLKTRLMWCFRKRPWDESVHAKNGIDATQRSV
jgi:hypothetical protein